MATYFISNFQKQVVKSQFSVYDAFCHEPDPNEIKSRNLAKSAFLDSNILRDVNTLSSQVPSDNDLK